jgi:hypothetical protein
VAPCAIVGKAALELFCDTPKRTACCSKAAASRESTCRGAVDRPTDDADRPDELPTADWVDQHDKRRNSMRDVVVAVHEPVDSR